MGENWVQRVSKRYRHHLQQNASKLAPPPLFCGVDEIEKQYVGHLELAMATVDVGSEIRLFLSSKRARPALVIDNEVVGYVEGDSAADLQEQAKDAESWPVLVRMKVVSCGQTTNTITITPITQKPRKG